MNFLYTLLHITTKQYMLLSGEAPDSKQRRLNMIKAVEGDDWSAVIDSQTQQTVEGTLVAWGCIWYQVMDLKPWNSHLC